MKLTTFKENTNYVIKNLKKPITAEEIENIIK